MVSEAQLQATGLPEKTLETYRVAKGLDVSLAMRRKLAKRLGVTAQTVKRHLDQIRARLDDSESLSSPGAEAGEGKKIEMRDPDRYAQAIAKLSQTGVKISEVARELGLSPHVAARIAQQVDADLQPLRREIEDVSVAELTHRYGTLARDAMDHITHEKLRGATAQQLAVIAGIAGDKFQLYRGAPTSRTEITDRREMNELVKMVVEEAKRRHIEIDVTPEGGVSAGKSPYKNIHDQRLMKQVESGDPPEAQVP